MITGDRDMNLAAKARVYLRVNLNVQDDNRHVWGAGNHNHFRMARFSWALAK